MTWEEIIWEVIRKVWATSEDRRRKADIVVVGNCKEKTAGWSFLNDKGS